MYSAGDHLNAWCGVRLQDHRERERERVAESGRRDNGRDNSVSMTCTVTAVRLSLSLEFVDFKSEPALSILESASSTSCSCLFNSCTSSLLLSIATNLSGVKRSHGTTSCVGEDIKLTNSQH